MANNYHHSVSNRLILEYSNGALRWVVTDKQYNLLADGTFTLVDDEILSTQFRDHRIFNEIFSSIQVLTGQSSFVCLPEELADPTSARKLFFLQHELSKEDVLMRGVLTTDIAVMYAIPQYLRDQVKQKFPIAEFEHEAVTFYRWVNARFKTIATNIIVSHRENGILAIVQKDGEFKLCNEYPANNPEEIFFYIMTLVEQLELDPEQTTLSWVGHTSKDQKTIFDTFEPYIQKVNFISDDFLSEYSDLINFYLKCAS
ncbi:MAG: DUF3822 family protein [Bacteroidetes bacterium]|nr:DUF3822 family protein [Bacteroidota bacterium]